MDGDDLTFWFELALKRIKLDSAAVNKNGQ